MRITRKCSGDLHAHSLAKYDSNGVLVAYDNVGDVAGIVSQCRDEVVTVNDIEETHHVCSLVYKDIGTCRVSGTVSAQGSIAYSDGIRVSATGTNEIGYILPKPFPQMSDYQDGDIAQVLLK